MTNITLNNILSFHDEMSHPSEIKHALGDGYVLRKSKLAEAIRKLAVNYGYSYTNSNFSFADTLPVISLAYFLRERKITYTNNLSVLKELNKTVGDFVNSNHLLKIGFPNNSILHESAHCIAHHHFFENRNPFSLFNLGEDISVIFKFLIAESYSQTAEVLNFRYFINENTTYLDLFMLKFNTFVNVKSNFINAVIQIEKYTNAEITFMIIMLIFFCHNLKNRTINQDQWDIIKLVIEKSYPLKKQIPVIKILWSEIFDISLPIREFIFSLGHDFINFTTPLFFKNLGYRGDYTHTLVNDVSLDLFLTEDNILKKSKEMIDELHKMI